MVWKELFGEVKKAKMFCIDLKIIFKKKQVYWKFDFMASIEFVLVYWLQVLA
jgi:hypothetical protein